MSLRILVTGSRSWTDRRAVARAILDAISTYAPDLIEHDELGHRLRWSEVTIVHGDRCRTAGIPVIIHQGADPGGET